MEFKPIVSLVPFLYPTNYHIRNYIYSMDKETFPHKNFYFHLMDFWYRRRWRKYRFSITSSDNK